MEDMSDMIKQFSEMVEKDGIPDNLKEVISGLNLNDFGKSTKSSDEKSKSADDVSSSFGFDGLDINTLLKFKGIMDKMNVKDDPRSKLLLSLKPYLKDSRKSKIEQYVQFLNIASMMDVFKSTGGDSKNDV